jgi:hypothetical protein
MITLRPKPLICVCEAILYFFVVDCTSSIFMFVKTLFPM